MERKSGFKNLEEFLQSPEDIKAKISTLKRSSGTFIKKLEGADRIKFWLALIPEDFAEKIRNFYRLVKVKNSVKLYTRHKVIVDYDTLYLAKQINEANRDDYLLITNARLSLMRTIISLYLAFNRDFEYHRGWSHISYAIMSLGATEEDTFVIFSHLVQNILPKRKAFYKAGDNNSEKIKMAVEFYLLAERQRYGFCHIMYNSASKNQKDESEIFDLESKTKNSIFYHENIKEFGLFTLLKNVVTEWFGALFSNVLHPKDCLVFWDQILITNYRLLFRFGLSLLSKSSPKLEQILKKERKGYSELGIDAPQHYLLLNAYLLKKQLLSTVSSSDFQTLLLASAERKDSSLMVGGDKKFLLNAQEITNSLFTSRLRFINELKRELESSIPLDTGRVLTIFQIIEDSKTDKITAKDLIGLLNTNQIAYPALTAKMYTVIDQNLKGVLSKKDIKNFFSIVADTLERKIKLFWRDTTKGPLIDPNEAVELLQMIDCTINYDSTAFDETVSLIYDRIVRFTSEPSISADIFINFIKRDKACTLFIKQLSAIDGKEGEDHIVPSEIYDEEGEKTEQERHKFSSPTYGELSSKGRISISRKSGLGFEIDRERLGFKEDLISEDQQKIDEASAPGEKADLLSLVYGIDENLPITQPPTFLVRFPIMSPKKQLPSLRK